MQRKRKTVSVLAILLAGSAAQADLLSADISIGGGSLASADVSVGGGAVGATATVGGGSVADADVSIGRSVDASVSVGAGGSGTIGGGGGSGSGTGGSGGSSGGGMMASGSGGSGASSNSNGAVTFAAGRGGGSNLGVLNAARNLSLYSADGVRLGTILSMENAGSLTRVTISLDPALGHGTSRMTFRTAVSSQGQKAFRIGQSVRAFISLL